MHVCQIYSLGVDTNYTKIILEFILAKYLEHRLKRSDCLRCFGESQQVVQVKNQTKWSATKYSSRIIK